MNFLSTLKNKILETWRALFGEPLILVGLDDLAPEGEMPPRDHVRYLMRYEIGFMSRIYISICCGDVKARSLMQQGFLLYVPPTESKGRTTKPCEWLPMTYSENEIDRLIGSLGHLYPDHSFF